MGGATFNAQAAVAQFDPNYLSITTEVFKR
jgi:hypothetical protein